MCDPFPIANITDLICYYKFAPFLQLQKFVSSRTSKSFHWASSTSTSAKAQKEKREINRERKREMEKGDSKGKAERTNFIVLRATEIEPGHR